MSYFQHEATPYPLADKHGDVPSDILVDISLTVPGAILDTAVITVLQTTTEFAFLAVETPSSPVAHIFVQNPIPGRLYQLDEGVGWVVFGPGVNKPFQSAPDATFEIDPNCLIIEPPDIPDLILVVNGTEYTMPRVLNVEASGFLQLQVTEREVQETPGIVPPLPLPPDELGSSDSSGSGVEAPSEAPWWGPVGTVTCIEISRNDGVIDPTILTRGLVSNPLPPVRNFGGASPDENGNIDIIIVLEAGLYGDGGVYLLPCGNPDVAGYVLWTIGVPGCGDDNLLSQLKFSDCGEGRQYELPFDKILDGIKCTSEDDPCGPPAPTCL